MNKEPYLLRAAYSRIKNILDEIRNGNYIPVALPKLLNEIFFFIEGDKDNFDIKNFVIDTISVSQELYDTLIFIIDEYNQIVNKNNNKYDDLSNIKSWKYEIEGIEEITNESYNKNTHKAIALIRNLSKTKIFNKISKFLSIIDDLKRWDFKALKHSLKNKEGFKKLSELYSELKLIKELKDKDEDLTFQDLYRYGFDSKKILSLLEDEDVVEYFKHDLNIKNKVDELDYLIDFVKEYDEYLDALKKAFRK